jgi:hypothetical protein
VIVETDDGRFWVLSVYCYDQDGVVLRPAVTTNVGYLHPLKSAEFELDGILAKLFPGESDQSE